MSEPREWWINRGHASDTSPESKWPSSWVDRKSFEEFFKDCVHVIEKSAYDQLLQRNGELEVLLKGQLAETRMELGQEIALRNERIAELERENEFLKNSLRNEAEKFQEETKTTSRLYQQNESLKKWEARDTMRILDLTEANATLELLAERHTEILRETLGMLEVYQALAEKDLLTYERQRQHGRDIIAKAKAALENKNG